MMIYDVMPIIILFTYLNICYDEYSHPFVIAVVVLYYGVCALGVQTLKTSTSSYAMFRRWVRRYTSVAII